MQVIELKQKRILAGISGAIVCTKTGMSRSRLSNIERGYLQPSAEELDEIAHVLDALIEAKQRGATTAKEYGWPIGVGAL